MLKGEGMIDTRSIDDHRTIRSASLSPGANIFIDAYEALVNAEKIVFCPGDLYTSVIPNTLVVGFREAISKTGARLIYVVNIMTKKAETHDFTASQFAKTLLSYVGAEKFDAVVCNATHIDPIIRERYKKEYSVPVPIDREELACYTEQIVEEDLADQTGDIVRHKEKIASVIARL